MPSMNDLEQRQEAIAEWCDANPLRVWRSRNNLSLRRIAQLIGTNYNSVHDWEQGQYDPRPESMRRITACTNGDVTGVEWAKWRSTNPLTRTLA